MYVGKTMHSGQKEVQKTDMRIITTQKEVEIKHLLSENILGLEFRPSSSSN